MNEVERGARDARAGEFVRSRLAVRAASVGAVFIASCFLLVHFSHAGPGSGRPSRSNAPRARIVPVASLKTLHLPALESPWSPNGTLLALLGREGLYVVDASRPQDGPRLILKGYGIYVSWSPDGRWLASLEGPDFRTRTDRTRIIAVSATGSQRDTVYEGPKLGPFLWASDGYIYGWELDSRKRRRFPTPVARRSGWKSQHVHPELVIKPGSLRRFVAGPEPQESDLWSIDSLAAPGHVSLYDHLPDGTRYLIHGPGTRTHAGESFLVDDEGRILRSLGWRVRWTSLSADGRLVVGDQEVDDGHTISSSNLFVGDARGRWRVLLRSEGVPMNPWLSREGNFIVWEEEGGSGGLRVGRLEVQF